MRNSFIISKYLIGAVLPYFFFAWLLLSVILFVQQAGRFSDIFFSINIPSKLIWQLAIALIPNVIAFTCPMAVLAGTVIGLSKMQGDSELVALRSSGISGLQIAIPMLMLGIVLSLFSFAVNLFGVPLAARIVRTVATQTAILKLESPIEPGVFNTEVAGYTIYVRDGDLTDGQWKDIFIHTKDPNTGEVRLITSKSGRIDSTGQFSELVLKDAASTTISSAAAADKFVSERIGEIRIGIRTQRGELIQKLASGESSAEELGLSELFNYARTKEGAEKTEAEILWQRRILLSVTPIIFCLFGTVLVLSMNRGGRGLGAILSLLSLITFYLLAFLGEQLARTGKIAAPLAGVIPVAASIVAILLISIFGKSLRFIYIQEYIKRILEVLAARFSSQKRRNLFVDLTTGLRDFDILENLAAYYLLSLGFLGTVFLIFTAFELWRFAGTMDGGIFLLAKYLFFLIPFIYLQLSPSAAMISTLATYVIKSRRNEIVTWISSGQSVYRLLFPCFAAMIALGLFNFAFEELVAPRANVIQDGLRQQLRSRGKQPAAPQLYWVSEDDRIYSFIPAANASDNEKRADQITVYEFVANGGQLQTLYRSNSAVWRGGKIELLGDVRKSSLSGASVGSSRQDSLELSAVRNPFKEVRKKPSQMNVFDTAERIAASESEMEQASFQVALARKWSTLVLPFVIALFTAPFALSLNRKGKAATVGYAVGLWLLFMGITSVFEQMGLSGGLYPAFSVWAPQMAFALLGIFLLTRVKT